MAPGNGKPAGRAVKAAGNRKPAGGAAKAARNRKPAGGAAEAAGSLHRPGRVATSDAGKLLRAGFNSITTPRSVAIKLSANPAGEKYKSEQFTPYKDLKRGVLVPSNRFGLFLAAADDDIYEEAAVAAGPDDEFAGEEEAAGPDDEFAGEEEAAGGGDENAGQDESGDDEDLD